MSTPREQYDAMLDELDTESKVKLIDHVPFAKLLQEVDPVAYRCGANDYQPACDECGREYWADDPDDEAVCQECRDEAEQEQQEQEQEQEHEEQQEQEAGALLPQCAIAMGCLCAAHAKGRDAKGPCDADERVDPAAWLSSSATRGHQRLKYGDHEACTRCGQDIEWTGRTGRSGGGGWRDRGNGDACLPWMDQGELIRPVAGARHTVRAWGAAVPGGRPWERQRHGCRGRRG